MKSFESVNFEPNEENVPKDSNELEDRELKLLRHEIKPKNFLEVQITLAEDLFLRDHPDFKEDIQSEEVRNRIMEYWIEGKRYSDLFKKIRLHPAFIGKQLFGGDPSQITLEMLDLLNNDESLDITNLDPNYHLMRIDEAA